MPCGVLAPSPHVLSCHVSIAGYVIAYFEKKQPYVAVPWLWVPAYWHSGGLLAPVAP